MITYTLKFIEAIEELGINAWEIKLSAKTDNGARRQARRILRESPLTKGETAELWFFRTSDGCRGAIEL